MATRAEVEKLALDLPETERAVVAAHLLGSLPSVLHDEDEGIAEALLRLASEKKTPQRQSRRWKKKLGLKLEPVIEGDGRGELNIRSDLHSIESDRALLKPSNLLTKESVFVNVFGNYCRTLCRKRFLKVQILTESGMSRKITDIRQSISNRLRDAF
jgi:hypothetical protein